MSCKTVPDSLLLGPSERRAPSGPKHCGASLVVGVEEQGGNVEIVSLTLLTQPVEVYGLKSEPSRRTRHQRCHHIVPWLARRASSFVLELPASFLAPALSRSD